jgi:hypothetical protein
MELVFCSLFSPERDHHHNVNLSQALLKKVGHLIEVRQHNIVNQNWSARITLLKRRHKCFEDAHTVLVTPIVRDIPDEISTGTGNWLIIKEAMVHERDSVVKAGKGFSGSLLEHWQSILHNELKLRKCLILISVMAYGDKRSSAYLGKINADMRAAPADIHNLATLKTTPWVDVGKVLQLPFRYIKVSNLPFFCLFEEEIHTLADASHRTRKPSPPRLIILVELE